MLVEGSVDNRPTAAQTPKWVVTCGAAGVVVVLFGDALVFFVRGSLGRSWEESSFINPAPIVATFLLGLVAMAQVQVHWRTRIRKPTGGLLFLLVLVALGVSALSTSIRYPEANFLDAVLTYYAILTVPPALLALTIPLESLRKVWDWMRLLSPGLTALGLAVWYSTPQIDDHSYLGDVAGASHLLMGATMANLLVFNLFRFYRKPQVSSAWLILLAFSNAFLIVVSGSRGAILGTVVALTVMLVFQPVAMRFVTRGTAVILALAGALLIVRITESTGGYHRIQSLWQGGDDSAANRLSYFDIAWERFEASPLVGDGVGSFPAHMGAYIYPHNLVLEVANDWGVVGLLVLVLALLVIAKRVCAAVNASHGHVQMFGYLLLLATTSLMVSGSYVTNGAFWLLFGIVVIRLRWVSDDSPPVTRQSG